MAPAPSSSHCLSFQKSALGRCSSLPCAFCCCHKDVGRYFSWWLGVQQWLWHRWKCLLTWTSLKGTLPRGVECCHGRSCFSAWQCACLPQSLVWDGSSFLQPRQSHPQESSLGLLGEGFADAQLGCAVCSHSLQRGCQRLEHGTPSFPPSLDRGLSFWGCRS